MKKLFALLLCVMLILLFPVVTLAAGEGLENYIGPDAGVGWTLLVVALAIALDTLLGILLGVQQGEFDLRILPQFLFTGVLPYVGGLVVLAALAEYIGPAFSGMFYTAAIFTAGKYSQDVWDKLRLLFGIKVVE